VGGEDEDRYEMPKIGGGGGGVSVKPDGDVGGQVRSEVMTGFNSIIKKPELLKYLSI
jgi:hypothetical protein